MLFISIQVIEVTILKFFLKLLVNYLHIKKLRTYDNKIQFERVGNSKTTAFMIGILESLTKLKKEYEQSRILHT